MADFDGLPMDKLHTKARKLRVRVGPAPKGWYFQGIFKDGHLDASVKLKVVHHFLKSHTYLYLHDMP